VKQHAPKPIPYATVPRIWNHNATCVVLGSGPSLTRNDVKHAVAHADGVIAVNDSYIYAPDALALYAADDKWWKWHSGCTVPHVVGRTQYPAFTGQYRYTLGRTAFDVDILKKGPETGLSDDPGMVALGRNGVYQAMNVAVHFGAKRILLLGVDMQAPHPGSHFFGRHPDNSGPPFEVSKQRFSTLLEPMKKRGISVINCTRKTALTCFSCQPLEQALPEAQQIAV